MKHNQSPEEEKAKTKKGNKRLGWILILWPPISLAAVLALYAVASFVAQSGFAGGTSDPTVALTAVQIVRAILGFIGVISVFGFIVSTPIGIYQLSKRGSKKIAGARYKTLKPSSDVLVFLIGFSVLLEVVGVFYGIWDLSLISALGPGEYVQDVFYAPFALGMTSLFGSVFAFILSGVVFLTWVNRANKNLHAKGVKELHYTPGWAVGSWFVPFVNVVVPFLAVREIWYASQGKKGHEASRWSAQGPKALLDFWWVAWLVSTYVSRGSTRAERSGDVDGAMAAMGMDIAASIATIVAGVLLIMIIKKITEFQKSQFEK